MADPYFVQFTGNMRYGIVFLSGQFRPGMEPAALTDHVGELFTGFLQNFQDRSPL